MRYTSIDIETTGLDPERNEILSIGIIIEDTEKKLTYNEVPKLHLAINHKEITGSLFAINMNRDLIDSIARYQDARTQNQKDTIANEKGIKFVEKDDAVIEIYSFLYDNEMLGLFHDPQMQHLNGKLVPILTSKTKPVSLSVAGKNFGTFDKRFLEKLPRWQQAIRTKQRILDPAILFVDWKNDDSLPSLAECKKRAEIEGIVTHDALEDAWDVILLLRKFY